jgi:hypothetical protein
MAFHAHNRHASCPFDIERNAATLLIADLQPIGETEIWDGNQITASLAIRVLITMDSDGCPVEEQPYLQPVKILHKLVPL